MPDQIVSVAEIQRRARAAFERGVPLADCPFNWHSCAYATWRDEYARLVRAAAAAASLSGAKQQGFGDAANERLAHSVQRANLTASVAGQYGGSRLQAPSTHDATLVLRDWRNQGTLRQVS